MVPATQVHPKSEMETGNHDTARTSAGPRETARRARQSTPDSKALGRTIKKLALRISRGAAVRRRRSPEPRHRSARKEGGAGDWSNLTSGPPGPTVSDPEPARAVLSGGVKPEVRVPLSKAYFVRNVFFSVLF